jgi:hypothetical protein
MPLGVEQAIEGLDVPERDVLTDVSFKDYIQSPLQMTRNFSQPVRFPQAQKDSCFCSVGRHVPQVPGP